MSKFYITTPIYYVNDVPHIGSAYTTIAADVVSRFHKQERDETYFLTGTDEHGAKIAEASTKAGLKPEEYADKISGEFKKAWKLLNIDYSRFIRTTDEDHIKTAQDFLQKLYNNGSIDPKPKLYKGLYCVGHEKFMSPDELVNGLCPEHKAKPIEHSEENYFFNLSKFRERLINLIESDELKIRPNSRRNETLSKLKEGIENISISRKSVSWGIPLPFDRNHTSYVWIEALINYYTYGKPLEIWPADLHIIGKDILWFHAIVWPAMLLAIDEKPPKEIFVHGFFTIDGQKMSKTLGNVISPKDLVEKFGVDGARYLMLASSVFGEDGDISWKKFKEKYNSDLANGLGNLIARVAKLCENSNFTQRVPENDTSVHLIEIEQYSQAFSGFKFNDALSFVWAKITELDKYINVEKPWTLSAGDSKLKPVLSHAVDQIQEIAALLEPFLPETAKKIEEQFKAPKITAAQSLFPRIN